MLDKTGTVTTGQMSLYSIHPVGGADEAELMRLAAAVEAASEHPIAAAIVTAARTRFGSIPDVHDFSATPGLGVAGLVDGHAVLVGRASYIRDHVESGRGDPATADTAIAIRDAVESAGQSAVFVACDGVIKGVLAVGDTIKDSSAAAITALRALGLRPMLLTGDNRRAAEAVAARVGITAADVIADVLSEAKLAAVRTLQADGHAVAMVGDGVNDAAALATADLGLAIGTGTDVAIEAADITLVRADLTAVGDAIRLSRSSLRTIKVNLFWAFAYNVVLIPVAALGLLSPLIAGLAMACSSLLVVANSLRLRRFR